MKIKNIKLSRKVYGNSSPLEYAVSVSRNGKAELFLDGNVIELECSEMTFLNLEKSIHEIGFDRMKSDYLIHGGEKFSALLEIAFEDGTIKTVCEDISTFFGQMQREIIGKMIRFNCDQNLFPEEDYTDALNLCVFDNELDTALKLDQYLSKRMAS